MKVYKTQQEVEKDIKNGVLAIEGDVTFECSISIDASIHVKFGHINAGDIKALNINAGNINAGDIKALNINAGNINAGNINAGNINAGDIKAGNINARDITAKDISYYAFMSAYNSITCKSWKARRVKAQNPVCLDGKLTLKDDDDDATTEAINLLKEKGFKIIKG